MMDSSNSVNDPFYKRIRLFPTITDGKINIKEFLDAATDLVTVVDNLGRVFAPVKYDMQGNIDKVKKGYKYDDETCLLDEIKTEIDNGSPRIAEGVLWLNRTILFFEIMFQEIIKCLKSNNIDVSMKKIFTVAYEGSVKQYHNWVTQQIFLMVCRLSPRLPQCLNALEADSMPEIEIFLNNYVKALTPVRCAIDNIFIMNNTFS